LKIPASWGTPSSALETVILQPWNDITILEKTIKQHADEIACVITEPVLYNIGAIAPEDDYLKAVQELCNENDIVLILDEMITGFRLALGGAQEYFGIDGDLMCFGKALAGGMPLSAVCGKREIMEVVHPSKVAHMGTFNITPLAAAASLATLGILSANDGSIFNHLTKMGDGCREALNTAAERTRTDAIVQGVGGGGSQIYFTKAKKITNYREFFTCDMTIYPKFQRECMKRGVYFHPWQMEHLFICTAHTQDDIAKLENAATEALTVLAS
jgi:glutamate-1-semialdehyde 2,1-aminomutase